MWQRKWKTKMDVEGNLLLKNLKFCLTFAKMPAWYNKIFQSLLNQTHVAIDLADLIILISVLMLDPVFFKPNHCFRKSPGFSILDLMKIALQGLSQDLSFARQLNRRLRYWLSTFTWHLSRRVSNFDNENSFF